MGQLPTHVRFVGGALHNVVRPMPAHDPYFVEAVDGPVEVRLHPAVSVKPTAYKVETYRRETFGVPSNNDNSTFWVEYVLEGMDREAAAESGGVPMVNPHWPLSSAEVRELAACFVERLAGVSP